MKAESPVVTPDSLKDFLVLSYDELQERNLEMREFRDQMKSQDFFKEKCMKYLSDEKRIKAVKICFTDLEGKLLSLDYDKNYILKSMNNLTFDGSSVRGFSTQDRSDLILEMDWSSFRWLPSDVFGPGKVLVFANVLDQNRKQYDADFRGRLHEFVNESYKKDKQVFNLAPEIEGFLFKGVDVEQKYSPTSGFELVTSGGYYDCLPQDNLMVFIDAVAEAKRAMGFVNEKDHPEVAPSQFELNYKYTNPVQASDQIQLYKLLCRQIAKRLGCTASFLPKPIANINGSGMHMNISVSKAGTNLFSGADGLSDFAQNFATSILYHAKDLCLILNPSVNSYRRLDRRFEAPNEIKMTASDRGSMIRVPVSNNKEACRIEVRSTAPDVNPYMAIFSLLKVGFLQGDFAGILKKREKLPANIYDAIRYFDNSDVIKEILSPVVHNKYCSLKEATANRCPKELGNLVKDCEILYHHEVTNQILWSRF